MIKYDLNEVVRCKYCGQKEYWGKMIWLDSKELCRDCYAKALGKYPYAYSAEEIVELCR
ncbi:MAG: hypothetical protein J5725_06275 [Bacteroidales bacterium]|nr:hypothetical protein [Bacteroidales bacterium]